ncbi:MAG: polymer-forming cytoskeletal protein [Candidatus Buchananbacteria bacterium]|nr:polymer-forming cytoskeletal protein [Candidatus Buchananbacteria bacterium]
MQTLKKFALISLIGLFLIVTPVVVFAASNTTGESVYVAENEIIQGNLIRFGNVVEINGPVAGDVIVAGNSVKISGAVAGDVIVAGNSVKISGPVAGSVRVIGEVIEISSVVDRNIWAIGRTIAITKEARAEWDLFSAGETVEARGAVKGNVWLTGATVLLGGEIGKDVTASVDRSGRVVLLPEAKISGNLTYKAATENQLELQAGATVAGQTVRQDLTGPHTANWRQAFWPLQMFFKIVGFFSLVVLGIILVSLVPKIVLDVYDEMTKNIWPSIGWGALYFFAIPVGIIILFLTIIGIPLALLALPLYLILIYATKVFAALALGLWIITNFSKEKKHKGSLILPLVLGLIVFTALGNIPLLGWLASIVLIWWALGALIQVKKNIWREFR